VVVAAGTIGQKIWTAAPPIGEPMTIAAIVIIAAVVGVVIVLAIVLVDR
jgi:hypothetical protein